MVERRHQDLVGIPGPMQCEAGSKLGELVIPRHCRYCCQSWVRKRLKRILSILNTLLYFLQLVFIIFTVIISSSLSSSSPSLSPRYIQELCYLRANTNYHDIQATYDHEPPSVSFLGANEKSWQFY